MCALKVNLRAGELASLRELAHATGNLTVFNRHNEKLILSGFAAIKKGALIITTLGRGKLILEITRVSWLSGTA